MSRTLSKLLPAAVATVLAGCAVGPDYRPPQTVTPEQWHQLPQTGVRVESPDAPSLAAWWTTLNDPQLNEFIERALADNKTVKQAYARVVQSRAQRAITGAGFWPNLGASSTASRSKSESSFNESGEVVSTVGESYSAGLSASWELDIFGGQRRSYEAATAQLAATEAELRDVLVVLLGDVALSYVGVRTAQSRLDFAERNLESQAEALDITRWRAEAGLTTVLDVESANTSYQQTLSQIPQLESNLSQNMNRLAVLTGQVPGALADSLKARKPIPIAPVEIVAGVPADVLRRRPDIRSAERSLAAQTAQVGVATAALYPSLSLSGSISWSSLTASDLFSGSRNERSGLSLSLPLFNGGALRQNIKAQNAAVDQALASYESVVLAAYEEVENALDAWTSEQRRHVSLLEAVDSARRAAELALVQYNSGLVDFQTVLTADRQLLSLEDSLAVSDGEITGNLIRLYKALGGGWSVFPTATTASGG
ncbi:efflux transporter outer membrane subunit [Steroidobacter sp.]|uniref:efflux transporter outer membrane subunit n=1 Tax=Steroidobacter sp. TaxID=1978227 RepID=UPI001A4BE5B1|nr:efflux transporter outer membrane subunit [Steroidobacter sp.]MBL8267186.1 efflux transporter outer membrane subunit [Steroidobacter sp.]